MKFISFIIFISVLLLSAGTIPSKTDLVITDTDGKTWDIDSLLDEGKHIWMHQAWSG